MVRLPADTLGKMICVCVFLAYLLSLRTCAGLHCVSAIQSFKTSVCDFKQTNDLSGLSRVSCHNMREDRGWKAGWEDWQMRHQRLCLEGKVCLFFKLTAFRKVFGCKIKHFSATSFYIHTPTAPSGS